MRVDIDRIVGKHKKEAYRNSEWIASALSHINEGLEGLEQEYVNQVQAEPEWPIVLISFLPRSGSTLLYQLLAKTGNFNYISNFQSRFWRSPCVGRLIENSISPRLYSEIQLSSDFGNTKGFSSPHEFNYFWEEHLGIDGNNNSEIKTAEFTKKKQEEFRKEIIGLLSQEAKPLLFKREYLILNLSILKNVFPNVRIINLERNFDDIISSQMKAIEKVHANNYEGFFGTALESFVYDENITLESNVRRQTKQLKERLDHEIEESGFPAITVEYEKLCQDAESEMSKIKNWISAT